MQQIEILPADEPRALKLGWTVSEQIGVGIVSHPGARYDGCNVLNKHSARNLLSWHGIYPLDGGWAIVRLSGELVPSWPPESTAHIDILPMRDEPNKGKVIKWAPAREPLEQEFAQAQDIIDQDMYVDRQRRSPK